MAPITYGKSEEHLHFPGTVTLSGETLLATMNEVGESVYRAGFRKLLFVNGHGGQPQVMEITAWQKQERLALSSRQGGIVVGYDYEFSTVEAGTRIQLTSSCEGDNWFWRAIARVLEWTMRLADRKQLEALDKLVRATTGSGT